MLHMIMLLFEVQNKPYSDLCCVRQKLEQHWCCPGSHKKFVSLYFRLVLLPASISHMKTKKMHVLR